MRNSGPWVWGPGAPRCLGMRPAWARANKEPCQRAQGLNSSDRRVPEAGGPGSLRRKASGGAGVRDSRINVLKLTTPSSPCRKMPKLHERAALAAARSGRDCGGRPPGSEWLELPAGPCIAGLARALGAAARPPGLPTCWGRATEPRAPSPSREPVPALQPTQRRA